MKRWTPADYMIDAEGQPDEGLHEYVRVDDLPRWIPVSERLPEDGKRVLAVTRVGGLAEVGEFTFNSRGEWFSTDYGSWNATHWMPLPEPPEAK